MSGQRRLRCAYLEGQQRCRRAGTGNPPLCAAHRLVLEETAHTPIRPGERLIGLIGRMVRGQRVSDEHLFSGLDDLMGIVDHIDPGPRWEPLRRQVSEVASHVRGRRADTPPRQRPTPRKSDGPDPRVVLGFSAGEQLDATIVKARHRELARKHHPDRGGSVEKMQQINVAVEKLLASL